MTATSTDLLLDILGGLVPLHLMRLQHHPGEMQRAYAEAGDLADAIAEHGDRLTNSGSFRDPAHRAERARVLSAMATCLALGAMQPGGVTWAGRHWCTDPATCAGGHAGRSA